MIVIVCNKLQANLIALSYPPVTILYENNINLLSIIDHFH